MEYSLQAYLERRTVEELMCFLEVCMQCNRWEAYAQTIPQILMILQSRNVAVAEQILSSWDEYIRRA